ncbi:MAG: sortase domain-containing protein [Sulfobacillus sp.]
MLIIVAAFGVAYPLWWNQRAAIGGRALMQSVHPASAAACKTAATQASTSSGPGVLAISAIGLEAPVVQGLTNAVLDVAVGHDPVTVWPGGPGESVLLAHDVSYFSALDQLRPGDLVTWTAGCTEAVFQVTAATVTEPGATIPLPASGFGLALITCWPTNSLFWTSQRYMVETKLVSTKTLARPPKIRAQPLIELIVPAPAALVRLGISPTGGGIGLGRLVISGTPTQAFAQSPQPLVAANAALEDYVAAEKTAAAGNANWWHALAVAGVPLPAPWSLSDRTNVTLMVSGQTVQGVVLSSPAQTLTLTVRAGVLLVSQVGAGQ